MIRTKFNQSIGFGKFHCLMNRKNPLPYHVYIGWSPLGYYIREAVPVEDSDHKCRFPAYPFRLGQRDIDQIEKLVKIHNEFNNVPLPELVKVGKSLNKSIKTIPRPKEYVRILDEEATK